MGVRGIAVSKPTRTNLSNTIPTQVMLWISVGQEPDVRGLLAELLRQSNGRVLEAESNER